MGRELHPVESYRRSLKKKAVERRRAARKEALSKIPIAKRDPSKLLMEIERLREAECQDGLDGPGRMRRKHLEEQFRSLNKAREKAKLPTLHLTEYDPDMYRARLQRLKAPKTSYTASDEETDTSLGSIPLPDDTPYTVYEFPSILPPYPQTSVGSSGDQTGKIIARPASNLDNAVDQFLKDIGGA